MCSGAATFLELTGKLRPTLNDRWSNVYTHRAGHIQLQKKKKRYHPLPLCPPWRATYHKLGIDTANDELPNGFVYLCERTQKQKKLLRRLCGHYVPKESYFPDGQAPRHLSSPESIEVLIAGTALGLWLLNLIEDSPGPARNTPLTHRFRELTRQRIESRENGAPFLGDEEDDVVPQNPRDPTLEEQGDSNDDDDDVTDSQEDVTMLAEYDDDSDNGHEYDFDEEGGEDNNEDEVQHQYMLMPLARGLNHLTPSRVRDSMADPQSLTKTIPYHLQTHQGRLTETVNCCMAISWLCIGCHLTTATGFPDPLTASGIEGIIDIWTPEVVKSHNLRGPDGSVSGDIRETTTAMMTGCFPRRFELPAQCLVTELYLDEYELATIERQHLLAPPNVVVDDLDRILRENFIGDDLSSWDSRYKIGALYLVGGHAIAVLRAGALHKEDDKNARKDYTFLSIESLGLPTESSGGNPYQGGVTLRHKGLRYMWRYLKRRAAAWTVEDVVAKRVAGVHKYTAHLQIFRHAHEFSVSYLDRDYGKPLLGDICAAGDDGTGDDGDNSGDDDSGDDTSGGESDSNSDSTTSRGQALEDGENDDGHDDEVHDFDADAAGDAPAGSDASTGDDPGNDDHDDDSGNDDDAGHGGASAPHVGRQNVDTPGGRRNVGTPVGTPGTGRCHRRNVGTQDVGSPGGRHRQRNVGKQNVRSPGGRRRIANQNVGTGRNIGTSGGGRRIRGEEDDDDNTNNDVVVVKTIQTKKKNQPSPAAASSSSNSSDTVSDCSVVKAVEESIRRASAQKRKRILPSSDDSSAEEVEEQEDEEEEDGEEEDGEEEDGEEEDGEEEESAAEGNGGGDNIHDDNNDDNDHVPEEQEDNNMENANEEEEFDDNKQQQPADNKQQQQPEVKEQEQGNGDGDGGNGKILVEEEDHQDGTVEADDGELVRNLYRDGAFDGAPRGIPEDILRSMVEWLCKTPMCPKHPWEDFVDEEDGSLSFAMIELFYQIKKSSNRHDDIYCFLGRRVGELVDQFCPRLFPSTRPFMLDRPLEPTRAMTVEEFGHFATRNFGLEHVSAFHHLVAWLQAGEIYPRPDFLVGTRTWDQWSGRTPRPLFQRRILAAGKPRAYFMDVRWLMHCLNRNCFASRVSTLEAMDAITAAEAEDEGSIVSGQHNWRLRPLPNTNYHAAPSVSPHHPTRHHHRRLVVYVPANYELLTDASLYRSIVFHIPIGQKHSVAVVVDNNTHTVFYYDMVHTIQSVALPGRSRRQRGRDELIVSNFQDTVSDLVTTYLNCARLERHLPYISYGFQDVVTGTPLLQEKDSAMASCVISYLVVHLERPPTLTEVQAVDFSTTGLGAIRTWISYS